MEDLQNLMACIDEISSQIPDGMYLKMADQMKRVHDHMNGNKAFHEDTFYYSDTESDDDSDSDYEPPTEAQRLRWREREFQKIKDEILECVKQMHAEYKNMEKFDKVATSTYGGIKRMTAFRKNQAIKQWCEKNTRWAPGGEAGELVGCGPIVTGFNFWTWKNLTEWGLRTIVLEIGTDDEIDNAKKNNFFFEELSLKTLQKLPAFERQIYKDYKEECHRKWNSNVEDAEKKVRESEEKMNALETACVQREYLLGGYGAERGWRDFWSIDRKEFTTGRTIL